MKRIISLAMSFLIALLILGFIYSFWTPVATWYLSQVPAKGIDLFNSVSYTGYILKNLSLPLNGWKYTWYSGWPMGADLYPLLYYYMFMVPFAQVFGLVRGVQIFAIASAFATIAFSYLLFAYVSKNRILAAILALSVGYSVNTYRGLIYAGGIPVFATQAFFPLVLYSIIKYIRTANIRWLLLSGLFSGLGFLGHPQHFMNFIFPAVFLLIVLSTLNNKFLSIEKIKAGALYLTICIGVGFPQFLLQINADLLSVVMVPITRIFSKPASGGVTVGAKTFSDPKAEWARQQFFVSFKDTNEILNQVIIVAVVFLIIGLIIGKDRIRKVINTMAVVLAGGWALFNIYLLSIGINIFQGGWEAWYKLFWAAPIALGLIASQFFGVFAVALPERMKKEHYKLFSSLALELIFGALFLFAALSYFPSTIKDFPKKMNDVSMFSSTFPEALGAKLSDKELGEFKAEATPRMLSDQTKDYRLYSSDQTVNLWWSALFETPLARGYIDTPGGIDGRGGIFWMDSAFTPAPKGGTSLEEDWKTPVEVVQNNIKYLFDWNAIKYLEGNQGGSHQGYGRLADIVTSDKYIENQEKVKIQGGIQRSSSNPETGEWNEDYVQYLNYYQVKDDLVTPIHYATNAPAVLVVGGGDSFNTIIRDSAMMGLTSKDLIVADGPTFLDEVSSKMLKDFDAVILYKYDYKNYSAWSKIAKYIEEGGKVFVETGGEVKESSTVDLPAKYPRTLPAFFPIKDTKREDLGDSWDSEGEGELFDEVKVASFSALIFDGKPWNVSYPENTELNEGAEVMLSLNGKPVLAKKEYGEGLVIWSGFNLPYHALYNYNMEEGKLFVNILKALYGPTEPSDLESELQWVSPEKRIISVSSAKGVLFKEVAYDGWSASVKSDNGSSGLHIYKVGPAVPGYMYVRIPERMRDSNISVTFNFHGSPKTWTPWLISIFSTLLTIVFIISQKNFLITYVKHLGKKVKKKMGSWWEKEEDE